MKQYVFSNKAENDLIEIYHYGFLNYGEIKTEQYMTGIKEKCQFIANTPYINPSHSEFNPPVRLHHHKKHLIVYITKTNHIFIVRVLHEKMNIQSHLEN